MESNFEISPLENMKRVAQISVSHCGPAVLRMLLSAHGVNSTQAEIAAAAGIEQKIKDYGSTYKDLNEATRRLAPHLQFWYKMEGNIGDLARAIQEFKHPVGVEWQGLFRPEDQDDDDGHYSVIVKVDTMSNIIELVDPFYYREGEPDRRFRPAIFERRWWDSNEIVDQLTGRKERLMDHRLMFIVTLKDANFPEELGMVRA